MAEAARTCCLCEAFWPCPVSDALTRRLSAHSMAALIVRTALVPPCVDVFQRLFHDGQSGDITKVLVDLVVVGVIMNPFAGRVVGRVAGNALFSFFLVDSDVVDQIICWQGRAELSKPLP